jgi:hypothetical protein
VTLTGPGGSGKTRLAIEAAASLVPDYDAGVFWVGLAALQDPGLVPQAISKSVGARNGLAEHIGVPELLVLLDNLEQVIAAASELSALLAASPNLRSGSVIFARRSPVPSRRSPISTRERSTTPPVWRSSASRPAGRGTRPAPATASETHFGRSRRWATAAASQTVSTASPAWRPPATPDEPGGFAALRSNCAKPGDGDRSAPMYRSRTYRTPRWPRGVR